MPPFISCPACGCASKAHELLCPHCGITLRTDGNLKKTAIAIALGLAVAACGDDTSGGGGSGGGAAPEYGVPATGGGEASIDGGSPGTGGTTGDGGSGEGGFAAEYGVPGTGGAGGGL